MRRDHIHLELTHSRLLSVSEKWRKQTEKARLDAPLWSGMYLWPSILRHYHATSVLILIYYESKKRLWGIHHVALNVRNQTIKWS